MLKVQKLNKKYGDTQVLEDVSFTAGQGKITAFLGRNGAGKTTTMRIITGCLVPDSGTVSYDKKTIDFTDDTNQLLADVGYLPENNPLYKDMRVDEFLLFMSKITGLTSHEGLADLTSKCGLESVLTKNISQLSKGYRQRVGLAKALIGDPKYLILDEPTTGLDPSQKDEILELIRSISKNKTIIFSSHVLSEVQMISDNLVIISQGKIVAQGDTNALVSKQFQSSIVKLTTDLPKTTLAKELKKYEFVKTVDLSGTSTKGFKQYDIVTSPTDEDEAVAVFQTVVKAKGQISELYKEKQGLEELFKELTK